MSNTVMSLVLIKQKKLQCALFFLSSSDITLSDSLLSSKDMLNLTLDNNFFS